MSDYISREEAIKEIEKCYCTNCDSHNGVMCRACYFMDSMDIIEDIHAADVQPVTHGRWVLEREPNGKPYCFHCSECDNDFHHIGIRTAFAFCPNCGARMDVWRK